MPSSPPRRPRTPRGPTCRARARRRRAPRLPGHPRRRPGPPAGRRLAGARAVDLAGDGCPLPGGAGARPQDPRDRPCDPSPSRPSHARCVPPHLGHASGSPPALPSSASTCARSRSMSLLLSSTPSLLASCSIMSSIPASPLDVLFFGSAVVQKRSIVKPTVGWQGKRCRKHLCVTASVTLSQNVLFREEAYPECAFP